LPGFVGLIQGHLLDAAVWPATCVFQSFVQTVQLVAKVGQFSFFLAELLFRIDFLGLVFLFVAF
jgi:hypothetical protein